MKTSIWMWVAIAFIVLSVIMASFAWTYYSKYNYERSGARWWASQATGAWPLLQLENETVLLNDQTVSVPPSSSYVFTFDPSYAGYVEVIVSSSTSPNTYVVIGGEFYSPSSSNSGWNYGSGDLQVGYGGTVYFPVVPGQVTVSIANPNPNSAATVTVTIIYYS